MNLPLTVVILTKDASETLAKTLESVKFASYILAIDDGSTDQTRELLEGAGATIVSQVGTDFSAKRTMALSRLDTEWVLYVDADEVVSKSLAEAIEQIVTKNVPGAYRIRRRNRFLGKEMYDDYTDRLFHTSVISGWKGSVHESPVVTVTFNQIEAPLIHTTHRDITSMLAKTNAWSEYEASLRMEAHHPPMAWWRLVRIGMTFFGQNYFGKRLYRFGRAGLFESYFQMVDKLVVYTKLWELQQKAKT